MEWVTEENYRFRLSEYGDGITKWLEKDSIHPKRFATDVRQWVEEGLPDLSVSRQSSRLQWGIPVPGDESQTVSHRCSLLYMIVNP